MQCNLSGADNLTVGQHFELNCVVDAGEAADLKPESLELRLENKDKYVLKILKFEKFTDKDIKFTVTSYKAGDHDLKALQVVSGDKSYVLGDLKFSVKSVIQPDKPVSEPYPTIGPLGVHLPVWYWVVAFLFVAAVVGRIFWLIRAKKKKKKLLQDMQIENMAQEPLAQFFQTLRKLQRQFAFFSGGTVDAEGVSSFVEGLSGAYKLYFARRYQIPTFFLTDRQILLDFKKGHRAQFLELQASVRKCLAELTRAQQARGKMSAQDCMQLLELVRQQVEEIEAVSKVFEKGKEA